MAEQDYITNTYNALKSKVEGFDKTEQQYRDLITTDANYRANVRKALSAKVEGFNRTTEEFDSLIGIKKKESSESESPAGTSNLAGRSVNPMGDMANVDVQTPQSATTPSSQTAVTPATQAEVEKGGVVPPNPEHVAHGHSLLQGFAKEFNKSVSGTLRLADYAVNKLESTIGSTFFGKDFETARKTMADAGIGGSPFAGAADLVDRANAGAKDVPDNVVGAVVGGVGGIIPDLLGMALVPEVKVGGWLAKYGVQGVDKFAMYLAGKEGTAVAQAAEGGTPDQQMLAPLEGAAKGFTTGLLFNSFGKVSGKIGEGIAGKIVPKAVTTTEHLNRAIAQGTASTLSNALMFGGYSGLEELAQTGKITSKNVATNFGIGLALGAKDLGKLTFVRGMQSFIATPREQINKVAQSKATPEQMKAMSDEALAELNKSVQQAEPIDQFKLNEDIFAAQQRLGLPNEPEVQISAGTLETLAKLQRGEPVTNELLSQASTELYQIRKGLEGVSKAPTRKFTTDQIFQKTNALGNLVETLENAKQTQTENNAFLDAQSNHVVSAVVNDNLATLKAFTQEVISNPKEVKDAVNESDLPDAAKQELNQKIDQIATDNHPATLAAKPLETKIEELKGQMQAELDANNGIEQSDIAKQVKAEKITSEKQAEISNLEQQVRGIYENPPPPNTPSGTPASPQPEIAPELVQEQQPSPARAEAAEVKPQTPTQKFIENRELIGTASINENGNIVANAVRYGSEFGDKSRGGTWYEIPAYEGAKSSYESGWWGSREANMGVGGKEKYERSIELKNPYFVDWGGSGEARVVIKIANDVLGKEKTDKLKKGITGYKAEKSFARLENAISQELQKQGYDGIIIYDRINQMVHPKQAFVFNTSSAEAEVAGEVKPPTPPTNGQKEEGQGLLATEPKDLEQNKKYDCGASALRSVLVGMGEKITEAEMIKETGANNKTGTQLGKIVETAKNHGLDAESREDATVKDIETEITNGNNVILLQEGVGTTKKGKSYSGTKDGHYITVKSADGNKITFEDPATTGTEEMTYADLEKRWHGLRDDNETVARGQMIVIKPRGQGLLAEPGKEITPNPEVKADIETVANELGLSDAQKVVYETLNNVRAEKREEALYATRNELESKSEKLDDEIKDLEYEVGDQYSELLDDAETEFADDPKGLKERKAKIESDRKASQKRLEQAKIEKEQADTYKGIDNYIDFPDEIQPLLDRVNARLETRRGVAEGTDLFPEMANIPEFKAKVKQIKSTDNTITDETIRRIADQDPKELEQSAKDIERKAESNKETELEKAIDAASSIIPEPVKEEPPELEAIRKLYDETRKKTSENYEKNESFTGDKSVANAHKKIIDDFKNEVSKINLPAVQKVSDDYYVRRESGFEKVDGKPIKIEGYDGEYFVSKDGKFYTITESTTGSKISYASTRKQAIENAKAEIEKNGGERTLKEGIKVGIARRGLSPRYEFVKESKEINQQPKEQGGQSIIPENPNYMTREQYVDFITKDDKTFLEKSDKSPELKKKILETMRKNASDTYSVYMRKFLTEQNGINSYQKAISEGRLTAEDAKTIIESAGLEVPQDILNQVKQGGQNAIQEQGTSQGNVPQPAGGGKAVEKGKPETEPQGVAGEGEIQVKAQTEETRGETKVRGEKAKPALKASDKAINYLESLKSGNKPLDKRIDTQGWNDDARWNDMIESLQEIIKKNEDVFNKIVEKIQEFKQSDFYKGLTRKDRKNAEAALGGLIDQYGNEFTGANRAIIDRERAERGLSPVEIEERRTNQEGFDKAKESVDSGDVDPRKLARDIAESEKTPTENIVDNINALKYDRMRIENAYAEVVDSYLKAQTDGNADLAQLRRAEMKALDIAREYSDEALRRLGYEWHLAGKAMQGMIDRAYKLQNITARFEAAKGEKATDAELKTLKAKVDELEKTNKEFKAKFADQDNYWRDRFEKAKSDELKRIAKKEGLKQTKEQLNAEKDDLVRQMKKFTMGQTNVGIPPELLELLGKYAVNRAKAGVVDIKIIANEIYNELKDSLGGLTADDIRDALSGKDNANVVKLPTRGELDADVLAAKRVVRLTQKLDDIRNGKYGLMSRKAKRASTPEEKALEAEIKKELDNQGITKQKEDQATQKRIDALNKKLEEIRNNTYVPKKQNKRVITPEEQSILNEIKAEQDKLKKTPAERAISAVRSRYQTKITQLEEQIAKGDYTKKPRVKLPLPPDVLALKEKAERLKQDIDNEIYKQERLNWSGYQKTLDYIAKARRFMILSGYHVFGKLGGAAVIRNIATPLETIPSAILGKLPGISYFAKRAPRHGRFDAKAEAKALAMLVSKEPYKQAWKKLTTGKSSIDVAENKKRFEFQTKLDKILGYPGKLHGFIKEPVRQSEYKRSLEYRIQHAIENGIDVTDPTVLSSIDALARIDGNASIFMNNNLVTSAYRNFIRGLEAKGHHTSATVAKVLFPIVKVPTNIAKETGHLVGGLPYSSYLMGKELYKVLRDPAYEVSPEVADRIMYNIKKGSVGVGLFALGYAAPNIFGGYYQEGEKRDKKDVPVGGMKIGDFEVPKWMLHNPFIEVLQFGATVRRVHDNLNKNRLIEKTGIAGELEDAIDKGFGVAGLGVVQQIPFADEPVRLTEAATNTKAQTRFIDELATSMLIPQALRDAAKDFDRKEGDYVKRAKYTIGDYIQNDIPFWKNKLPEKGDRFVTVGKETYNALGEPIKSADEKTWKFIKDNDINILPPEPDAPAMRFINTKGEKVQGLDETQYAEFVKARGDAIKQGMDLMRVAMQDIDKGKVISSLMDVEVDGKKIFGTQKKAEMAYDFFNKQTTDAAAQRILSLGTRFGLFKIGALIRVPGDMKLELAKMIFDESDEEEQPQETKIRNNNQTEIK